MLGQFAFCIQCGWVYKGKDLKKKYSEISTWGVVETGLLYEMQSHTVAIGNVENWNLTLKLS